MDTGADKSVLMPLDAGRVGVDYTKLSNAATTVGIGGNATHFYEPAIVAFADQKHLYIYQMPIYISAPGPQISTIPSLLGRDILDQWLITYNKLQGQIHADVLTATQVAPLTSVPSSAAPNNSGPFQPHAH